MEASWIAGNKLNQVQLDGQAGGMTAAIWLSESNAPEPDTTVIILPLLLSRQRQQLCVLDWHWYLVAPLAVDM